MSKTSLSSENVAENSYYWVVKLCDFPK